MTDTAPTDSDPSDSSESVQTAIAPVGPAAVRPRAPRAIRKGTVLAGRFAVDDQVASENGTRLYSGRDLRLGERRVLVAVVAGDDAARRTREWLSADSPWTAPILDIVALDGRVAAVFGLDSDASPIEASPGASREQRAALLLELVHALDATQGQPDLRLVGPQQLWVDGLPADARLRIIPVPVEPSAGGRADDMAALARLIASQLYGIDETTAPDLALAALPSSLRSLLEPYYADDPTERLAAPINVAGFRGAFGTGAGASRVPVMLATPPPKSLATRVAAARHRMRSRSRREIAIAAAILALLAWIGLPLLSHPHSTSATSEVAEAIGVPTPVANPPAPSIAAIEPEIQTHPPQDLLWPARYATFYHDVHLHGPTPTPVGQLANPEDPASAASLPAAHPWESHVRVFRENAQIVRVERFGPANQFLSYDVFTYVPGENRVASITRFSSTGLEDVTRSFDWDRQVFEDRHLSGALSDDGCSAVEFELDDAGRFERLDCLGRNGDPQPFANGFERIRFSYAGDPGATRYMRENYLNRDDDPMNHVGGYAVSLTHFDSAGRVTRHAVFDETGIEPAVDASSGAHAAHYSYGQYAQVLLFLADGVPTTGVSGWHAQRTTYSSEGHLQERATYDDTGNLVPLDGTRIARIHFRTNDQGLVTAQWLRDVDGAPAIDGNGVQRIEYVRDAHNNILRECHFGLRNERVRSPALNGVHCVVYDQDALGQQMGERYYDIDFTPMRNDLAEVQRVTVHRDVRGRIVERRYFTSDGEPDTSWTGYHGIRYAYDAWGYEVGYEYFDQTGALVRPTTGVSSVALTRDPFGRETSRCFFDGNGKAQAMVEGFGRNAACFFSDYEDGELVRIRYTDVRGEPVLANFGSLGSASEITFEYAADGRLERQRFLGPDGEVRRMADCDRARSCVSTVGWSWHAL